LGKKIYGYLNPLSEKQLACIAVISCFRLIRFFSLFNA